MTDVTKLQDAQWRAIEAINKMAMSDASPSDISDAFARVVKHLDARYTQTKWEHFEPDIRDAYANLQTAQRPPGKELVVTNVEDLL